jgi:hypothetical protein
MDTNTGFLSSIRNKMTSLKYTTLGEASNSVYKGNSIWAKLVFIILVIIVFFILLRLGTSLLTYIFSPNSNPKLINGLKDATKQKRIPVDPSVANSIPILRSRNQEGGMEFTWTVWINIKNMDFTQKKRRHIFHKGSETMKNGMAYPNNAPGLYLHENKNTLIVVMNTFETINEEIEINDIPLNKWVNIAIRQRGKNLDVFVNGEVVARHIFNDVPKQNYGEVFVNSNGGFNGQLSDLWYHNYALTGNNIINIVRQGPNMRTSDGWGIPSPPYLSLRWYTDNDNNHKPMKGPLPWTLGT